MWGGRGRVPNTTLQGLTGGETGAAASECDGRRPDCRKASLPKPPSPLRLSRGRDGSVLVSSLVCHLPRGHGAWSGGEPEQPTQQQPLTYLACTRPPPQGRAKRPNEQQLASSVNHGGRRGGQEPAFLQRVAAIVGGGATSCVVHNERKLKKRHEISRARYNDRGWGMDEPVVV